VGVNAADDIRIGMCQAEPALPFALEVWCVHQPRERTGQ
jgi:hypothetical protein